MSAMASQITNLTIVYSTVYSGAQIKENIKAPRHWPSWGEPPVTGGFRHKVPVTRKMFPFYDVIMKFVDYGSRQTSGLLPLGYNLILKLDDGPHLRWEAII